MRLMLIALAAAATFVADARAAVLFRFDTGPTSDFVATPGGTVQVPVYLTETVTDGDASLLAAENGLVDAQVTVGRTFGVDTLASFTFNPGFDGFNVIQTTPATPPYTGVNFSGARSFAATTGVTGPADGDTTRVQLLTLTINASATAGDVSTFSLTDNPALTETITFGTNGFDGTPLDPRLAAGTFTVYSGTPEPATVAITVAGATLLLLRRRRGV